MNEKFLNDDDLDSMTMKRAYEKQCLYPWIISFDSFPLSPSRSHLNFLCKGLSRRFPISTSFAALALYMEFRTLSYTIFSPR
jgi:hypothetical protein